MRWPVTANGPVLTWGRPVRNVRGGPFRSGGFAVLASLEGHERP